MSTQTSSALKSSSHSGSKAKVNASDSGAQPPSNQSNKDSVTKKPPSKPSGKIGIKDLVQSDAKEGFGVLMGGPQSYEEYEEEEVEEEGKKVTRRKHTTKIINQIAKPGTGKEGISLLFGDKDADEKLPPSQMNPRFATDKEQKRRPSVTDHAVTLKQIIVGQVRDGVDALFGHDEEGDLAELHKNEPKRPASSKKK
ncbi:hypothetical protein BCR33DRAFT_718677 [Rhizoclosmatium globosum]|uniref:Uncharacterized protein n=1 Tax=Rhizoclosmatium globosum TaxID=329046 RepID=A0A1Y2C4V8_9FUNG|nr:hypothetical protein BCR33DRAFT_718677 [Rhizoclosmatium globosum]|eukprot:ORY42059.1 hypothetical protein BCR33DRAFT_718677 [Rhizoclosmatium globosum]